MPVEVAVSDGVWGCLSDSPPDPSFLRRTTPPTVVIITTTASKDVSFALLILRTGSFWEAIVSAGADFNDFFDVSLRTRVLMTQPQLGLVICWAVDPG